MSALLSLKNVHAYYGAAHILHGLDLHVNPGERVALIGRNGVGKTTVVNTILGLASLQDGHVAFGGKEHTKLRAYMAAQHGIAVVPQGRRIVANLTVEENLILGAAVGRKGPWSVSEIYKIFPILQERAHTPGTALSGGQQQMLAVGRALMANPALILLDEPTEGLAPVIVDQLAVIFNQVADQGTALLLIEQNMSLVVRVARRYLAMAKGAIVAQGEVVNSRDGLHALENHVMV
ncbi:MULTISPECIES: ABC transporter ATP-binding protein [unclassified Limnohabitans]|jgi:ABC-type branched-subunit amino acid transport system ATPase component|uniref:ABC transporter ATP-binding protein n=1 Tax=unclassified Limnohabitans TaxID=2626134 RepID=UPI000D3850CF|nr:MULTISPECIES: ABC transporter ATP-binding protein [unclassified Limnohabitans]PUE10971.1 ABC transporter ATP-binding protein [Limnohabitans sp. T6-5]PUE19090.1 ABC transporter ATP-binding protein [Limnohabitans sp. MMS-10A-192]PUE24304.1 ABC transporter ATP-binding protein [Limnohabitans sp. MMS-10A-160]